MPINLFIFNEIEFSEKILEDRLILNLMKILLVRAELSHADEETCQN
jgi:hypothetical protein